jgi:GNAT superfamily N-acetyltransferase
MWTIERLQREDAAQCGDLIFPGMRAKLAEVSDAGPHVAFRAVEDGRTLGVGYGEIDNEQTGHIRSLCVSGAHRKKGIGAALLRALEQHFAALGCSASQIAYMTEKPSTIAIERMLRSCGWGASEFDTLFCKIDERMLNWWAYQRESWLPEDFTLVDWTALTSEDRDYIQQTQSEQPWIPEDLVPFQYEENFEPLNSFFLRHNGKPIGWMITHRLNADTIRYTCSFVSFDLQRRLRVLPIYHEAYRRQHAAGIPYALFMVPRKHEAMVKFTRKHWIGKHGTGYESRIARKPLRKALAHAS